MSIERNKPIQLLWISQCVPYDQVCHAGGHTENFYIKQINSDSRFKVILLSFCFDDEVEKAEFDLNKNMLQHHLIIQKTRGFKLVIRQLINLWSKFSFIDRYANATRTFYILKIKKMLKNLKKQNYIPSVIVLEWTSIVLLVDIIKKYFPSSYIVSMEEDVTYLGYLRYWKLASNPISQLLWQYKYNHLKKIECKALTMSDLVLLNNLKDVALVKKEGVEQTFLIPPFFHNFFHIIREKNIKKRILFYGAMNRRENCISCIWFIENVFNKLENQDVKFYILGNKPLPNLKKYASDRIIITGFIPDPGVYFADSLCLVVPLVLGAGIKIKVLEGMSSGIPVITNNIGIEGIPAKKGHDFYYCETANDYIQVIDMIIENNSEAEAVGKNGRDFMRNMFDLQKCADELKEKLLSLPKQNLKGGL